MSQPLAYPRAAGSWRALAVFLGSGVLACALLLGVLATPFAGRPQAAVLVDDGGRCLLALMAGLACRWRGGRREDGTAPSWLAFGTALLIYGASTAFLFVAHDLMGVAAPWSLLRHVGYLASLAWFWIAALRWPAPQRLPTERLRTALDGLMIGAACLFLGWGLALGDMVARMPALSLPYALNLVYSTGYLALGAVWMYLEARTPSPLPRGPRWGLRIGFLLLIAQEITFGVLSIPGSYRILGIGELVDLAESGAFMAFGAAALWPRPAGSHLALLRRSRLSPALGYLPALVALTYAAIRLGRGQPLDPVMGILGGVLALVLCWREYLAQRDLEELSETLERRVESRTEELRRSQQALEQSRRLQMVSTMAAGVAHDLKNIFTVMRNWTTVLQAAPTDATLKQGLEALDAANLHAEGLMRQLMATGGRLAMEPRLFDLTRRIRELAPLLEGALQGSLLHLDLPMDPLPVFMDAGQLDQVLLNLATNARDAMPEGGTLSIKAAQDPYESVAILKVQDTGTGMRAELLERIFDPFFTTKLDRGGTGLGLASVQGIVVQSGGEIEAASEPGRGTLFTLRLPQRSLDFGSSAC